MLRRLDHPMCVTAAVMLAARLTSALYSLIKEHLSHLFTDYIFISKSKANIINLILNYHVSWIA